MVEALLKNISDKCIDINAQGKHHLFLQLFPHVSEVCIKIYRGGWGERKDSIDLNCYYDRSDAAETLENISLALDEFKEEETE